MSRERVAAMVAPLLQRRRAKSSARLVDAMLILMLLLVNPLAWSFGSSLRHYPPDALSYVAGARALLSRGEFFALHGHVDQALVLPPVYPALIAGASWFTDGWLPAAETVSRVCLLLAGPVLYLLISGLASRLTATVAVVVLQAMSFFFEAGLLPLSEATFVLVSSLALWSLCRLVTRGSGMSTALVTGALAAMVALTRHIGLLFLPLTVSCLAMAAFSSRDRDERRRWVQRSLGVIAGFSLLLGPYSAVVYAQTGHGPFSRKARLGRYMVQATPDDAAVLSSLRPLPGDSYERIYAKRRQARRLNAGATEMYAYLVRGDSAAESLSRRLMATASQPRSWLRNLRRNIVHLASQLGPWGCALMLVAIPLNLAGARSSTGWIGRNLVLLWIVVYLIGISLVASKIPRYTIVLVPFVFVLVAVALDRVGRRMSFRFSSRWRSLVKAGVPLSLLISWPALAPALFTTFPLAEQLSVEDLPVEPLRAAVPAGSPVFGLHGMDALMLGAQWRVLPNDSLERVVAYAARTGVRWIVVRTDRDAMGQISLYSPAGAGWYRQLSQVGHAPGTAQFVRLCCSSPEGSVRLYEILTQ